MAFHPWEKAAPPFVSCLSDAEAEDHCVGAGKVRAFMKEILRAVNKLLKDAGIRYTYGRKRGKAVYPYFTGMLYKSGGADESGEREYELLLTGFDRSGDDTVLIDQAERIEELFPTDEGMLITARSSTILVWADQFLPELPDTDEELSKCQITLKIRRWKG